MIFRSALRYLKFKPADGLHVVARGRVSVYEPKGEYQLVCEHLEPHGLGALQLAFEQLKKQLQAEGLFDAARKRPLPALPRKIGIVTSLDGAAIRDIIKVLRRRYANAHLVIRPARVQGEDAAPEIARALRQIARVPGVDVVIVGRGGGSIEDLWAFNEEIVARAIARVPVPVISAVGHETDVTIADFVADLRAPTPSAAAELVVVGARTSSAAASIGCSDRLRAAARARRAAPEPPRPHRRRPAGVRRLPRPRRDARPARRGAVARARAGSCAPALAARERRRLQLERQLDDVRRRPPPRRHPDAAGRVARPARRPRSRRRQHRADAQLAQRRRPARHAQPARRARPRLRRRWNADRTAHRPRRRIGRRRRHGSRDLVAGRAGLRGRSTADPTPTTPRTQS